MLKLLISYISCVPSFCYYFFFNDTATTEIYTLSLHDALPILSVWFFRLAAASVVSGSTTARFRISPAPIFDPRDRKSTRLNSSHANISYAVFCLKKKKKISYDQTMAVYTRQYICWLLAILQCA